jgi:hypothetical protein
MVSLQCSFNIYDIVVIKKARESIAFYDVVTLPVKHVTTIYYV